MFDIRFLDHAEFAESNNKIAHGRLRLGDFDDEFEASLEYWNKEQYQALWIRAINALVNGDQKASLITSLSDPLSANFFVWWPIYRYENEFRVQNHLLFLDELDEPFDLTNPTRSLRDRETISEDGRRISEWPVSLDSLREWLSKNNPVSVDMPLE